MSTVSRETLRTFLTKHARNPDRVPGAMELLEPFFRHAESGKYALAPASELDPEAVKTAIVLATGKPVTKVIFVSRAHPFPKPEWMSEGAYRGILRNSFGDSLGDSLGASLGDILRTRLEGNLGYSIRASLRASLGGSAWDSIGDSLWASRWASLGASLRDSLMASPVYFLGVVILDDAGKIERLTPIIQLLPRAIPIGEKQDEPGTWLVLVA